MRTALTLCLALLATGCFRMTIINGNAEAAPAPILEDKWRSSAVLDIVPIDVPLALDATCKETGWARIEQEHTALDYLVDVFLAGWVYESTHATVFCAKKGTSAAPAPAAPAGTPTAPAGTPTSPPGTPTAPPLPPSAPPSSPPIKL
ncbi:MAG TPA: hypothetical protein VLT33_39210 [Labilithrix sp.]|nr:hypothetical protein [Labilithrix sp.]